MGFSRLLLALAALIPLVAPVPAAAQQTPAAVDVLDVDGRRFSGQLAALTEERLSIADPSNSFELSDLLRLEFRGRRLPERLAGPAVYLANGDRLSVVPHKTTDGHLTARWNLARADATIPLETIRAVVFDDGTGIAGMEAAANADVLVFRNGDRLHGELVSIAPNAVTAAGPVGEVTAGPDALEAILFNPQLASFPKAAGRQILLMLTDGTRVTADRLSLTTEGTLTVEAAFGDTLALPTAEVVSMRFLGGRAVYLSDLEPNEYRFTPFLSATWPLRRDANVLGGALRLRGREYPKGLGVHSRCEVTYELDGRYRQFRSTVGIDDSAQGGGSAVFAVELDGQRVFASQPLSGRDEPLAVPPIDVSGKERLKLIVDYGRRGDIRDHADWCEAVLIR